MATTPTQWTLRTTDTFVTSGITRLRRRWLSALRARTLCPSGILVVISCWIVCPAIDLTCSIDTILSNLLKSGLEISPLKKKNLSPYQPFKRFEIEQLKQIAGHASTEWWLIVTSSAVRNSLIVLTKIIQHFPAIQNLATVIEKRVEKVVLIETITWETTGSTLSPRCVRRRKRKGKICISRHGAIRYTILASQI